MTTSSSSSSCLPALHQAVANDDLDGVSALLLDSATSALLEDSDPSGWRPLHHAASGGLLAMTELLLDLGGAAEIDAYDNSLRIPLHHAARNGHTAVVALLLDRGSDPKKGDLHGESSLHHAAANGHCDTVRLLLKWGAEPWCSSISYQQPLLLATFCGAGTDMLSVLLDGGASVNAADENGLTALIAAVSIDSEEAVSMLLDRGADIEAESRGETPLMTAVISSNTGMCQLLLSRGAALETEGSNKKKALHIAAEYATTETMMLLLDRGAVIDAEDGLQQTPLQYAAYAHRPKHLRMLLGRHTASHDALTAALGGAVGAIAAARTGEGDADCARCVVLLLHHGATALPLLDGYGEPPLHIAVAANNQQAAAVLLSCAAPIDDAGCTGRCTALCHAVDRRNADMVQWLRFDCGALAHACDDSGASCLSRNTVQEGCLDEWDWDGKGEQQHVATIAQTLLTPSHATPVL